MPSAEPTTAPPGTRVATEAAPADVIADEPIWRGSDVIGWVTSGGYAHHSAKSVALGYIRHEAHDPAATDYAVELLGEKRPMRIQPEPLFDPTGARMRG